MHEKILIKNRTIDLYSKMSKIRANWIPQRQDCHSFYRIFGQVFAVSVLSVRFDIGTLSPHIEEFEKNVEASLIILPGAGEEHGEA